MKRFDSNLSFAGLLSGDHKKPTIILLLAPILLTTWRYYGSKTFYFAHLAEKLIVSNSAAMTAEWYTYGTAFLLFGIIPLACVHFLFKEPISMYGLKRGDWRFGVPAAVVLSVVMVILSYSSSSDPQYIAEYPLYKGAGSSAGSFAVHAIAYLLFYFGWEIFFRGFIQFGLRDRFGSWEAILVQVALSCIVHIGKPDSEIYSSILGGLVWGVVVFRSRSIWPAVMSHWILGVSLDYFICFGR